MTAGTTVGPTRGAGRECALGAVGDLRRLLLLEVALHCLRLVALVSERHAPAMAQRGRALSQRGYRNAVDRAAAHAATP